MKNKNNQYHHKTIHQVVEETLRHKTAIASVMLLMSVSLVTIDVRLHDVLKSAYVQSWSFLSTYVRHEHPSHLDPSITIARIPKISSPS